MDAATKAKLFEQGGSILSDLARALINRPPSPRQEPATSESPIHRPAADMGAKASNIALPTSEETTTELKRRLAKELYRMELDLAAGMRIAGKPCDCGSNKHTLMLEAAAEELISYDPDNAPIYKSIIAWIPDNARKITPEGIQSGKYDSEYPRMANEFKMFRKGVLGSVADPVIPESGKQISTDSIPGQGMTLAEAKKLAAEEAAKEVERQWTKES